MAQKLAQLGLAVGHLVRRQLHRRAQGAGRASARDAVVVTVFSDSNKKYLSTDLLRTEPVKPGYLAPEVEVLGFDAMKRVCALCCDDPDCSQHVQLEERMARL